MINSKAELIERLSDMLAVEKIARDKYEEDVLTFKNFYIKDTIAGIQADEVIHVKLLEELIAALKRR